ncbi:NAD-dependent epimerase/dehydratase family protein [Limimaricola pyoseonensis]|uniref:NAD dependent epimerase/dehydratase family protein n=1 Tax=Limimaricola pyoseonensis TaxID=521013 RepID=A0A1G7HF33_9RHOB|nr:NAD(P)-dependent oxidoreductase [Limimaricola pyoseonensis]SDE99025.1 NAD dependent epimerase/dehydratase family protein [Limimaricola pyoseonensis]
MAGPVVITGAGGFVCSAMARALADAGYEVVAIDRSFDAEARAALTGIETIEADLLSGGGLPEGLSPGAVIHGAAITAAPAEAGMTPARHLAANTGLLTAMLDWAQRAGADRFLFLSSTGIFTGEDGQGAARLTEDLPATGCSPYAAAKRAGEILVRAADADDFATLSLRLGNIFGPGERARPSRPGLSLPHRLRREAAAGPVRSGHARAEREWSWLPDLARKMPALLAAMPYLEPGVLHPGAPPVLADREMARLVTGREVALPDGGEAPRPPMASIRRSPFDAVDWTPVADGLRQLGLLA